MAIHIAESAERDDVQAACDEATEDGATVIMPAGDVEWEQGISWENPSGILLGAGSLTTTGGGGATIIRDNISGATNLKLMDLRGLSRIAGFTAMSGTGTIKDGGTIRISESPESGTRIDHCRFDFDQDANYQAISFGAGVFGVMDHCICRFRNLITLFFSNGRQDDATSDTVGNLEWSLPTDFGGPNYFFIEDNQFIGHGPFGARVFDGYSGSKVVVRFNTCVQMSLAEQHATGHAANDRGARSTEIYGNAVTSPLTEPEPNFCAVDMSSGTTLAWGNTWDQVYKNIFRFNVTRKEGAESCGGDGTYCQTATPNGWGYAGTEFNGTGSDWDGGTDNGTDTLLGYPCLDQPGRGQGDLLVGIHPTKTNQATGTIAWPNQAQEPIYIWDNSGGIVEGWGGSVYSNNSAGRVVANRDYYPQASGVQVSASSPFDGTVGVGWGTLANRPTTCSPGVAYFATDQGDWNTSESNPFGVQMNGASGVLYRCVVEDEWELFYEPHTYPHPLNNNDNGAMDSLSLNQTENTSPVTELWRRGVAPDGPLADAIIQHSVDYPSQPVNDFVYAQHGSLQRHVYVFSGTLTLAQAQAARDAL